MKTTFEDRLLAELQGEIERREAVPVPVPVPAVRRRLFTGRRLALAAGACAVAGLAVVLVPGSPADSPAYAVERHDDGTVTLTLHDMTSEVDAEHQLAERLRAQGIHVTIDELPDGHQCAQPRGPELPWHFVGEPAESSAGQTHKADSMQHERVRAAVRTGTLKVTLRPGDSLAFENTRQGHGEKGELVVATFYAVRGEIDPCEPVKIPQPDRLPTGTPSRVDAD